MTLLLVSGLALVAIGVGLLSVFIDTEPARRWTTDWLEGYVEQRLERPVEIESLDLDLLPLRLELRNLRVDAPAPTREPLLTVPAILVEADLIGLTRPLLVLRHIRIERPELILKVAEDGALDLPRLVTPAGSRLRRRVGLEIGRLELLDGVIEVDGQRLPFELRARNIEATLSAAGGLALRGEVRSDLLELEAEGERYRFTLAGRLGWQRTRLEILDATLSGPGLEARGGGFWRLGAEGGAQFDVAARSELAQLVRLLSWPVVGESADGEVRLDATLTWTRETGWGVRGELEAPAVEIAGEPLSRLRLAYAADAAGGRIELAGGRYRGGDLSGSLTLLGSGIASLALRLESAELESLLSKLGRNAPRLAGRLHGALDYRFDLASPLAGSGWIDLEILAPADPPANRLPLSATLPLTVEGGVVASDAVVLELPGQLALGEGRYRLGDRRGRLAFEIDTADASVLADLVGLGPGEGGGTPFRLTGGRGQVQGEIELEVGRRRWPGATVEFELAELRAPGLLAERSRGSLSLSSSGVENLVLELAAGEGAVHISGDVSRQQPRSASRPVLIPDLRAEAVQWPLAGPAAWLTSDLDPAIAGVVSELSGSFSGSVEVTSRITGGVRGRIDALRFRGEELGSLALAANWSEDGLQFERLRLAAAAGEIQAAGGIGPVVLDNGEARRLELELRTVGLDLQSAPLATWIPAALEGELSGTVEVAGTFAAPQLRGGLRLRNLALDGRPLAADTSSSRVDFEWQEGRLDAQGELLDLLDLEGEGELTMDRADLRFAISSRQAPELVHLMQAVRGGASVLDQLDGQLAGELRVRASRSGDFRASAELVLEPLKVSWRGRELETLDPLRLRLSRERIEIVSLYLGEAQSDSELFITGKLDPHDGGLDLRLESSLDASWIELLEALEVPVLELDLDGRFELLATVGGVLRRPRLNGQGRLVSGRLILPGIPHAVDEIEALLLFYPQQVVLDRGVGSFAGGEIRAQGRVRLPPVGEPLEVRLQAALEDVDLYYPQDWNLRGDAELTLAGGASGPPQLVGQVTLDRASYLGEVELGIAQLLRRLFARDRVEVERYAGAMAGIELRLAVRGDDALRVRNRVADVRGDIDLLVRGTPQRPVLFGEVELESNGRLRYGGDDFSVDRGLLTFSNPYRIDPLIDLVAATRRRDYEITLYLTGTRDRLDATLQSDPPLPELDVLGLLAGGEVVTASTPLGKGAGAVAEGSFGALELLYGQATSLVEERVSTLFGLDRFRLAPLARGEDAVSSTRVTLGKQLSKDVLVTYSVDPASSEEYVVEVEWQVSDRLTVILTQNADGSYSADARLERSF